MRDRDPRHLHPLASAKMAQLLSLAQHEGIPVVLVETWRDDEQQDADQAAGLSKAGAGDSDHNFLRWAPRCSDCGHEPECHGPLGESQPGFRSCLECLRRCLNQHVADWARVPASLAWHFYIRDGAEGDRHAHEGGLEGLGANRLDPEDLARYRRLGELGRSLGLRWGGDWDGDGIPLERGENDLGHFSARPAGYTVAQVRAVLEIQGGDLVMRHAGLRA